MNVWQIGDARKTLKAAVGNWPTITDLAQQKNAKTVVSGNTNSATKNEICNLLNHTNAFCTIHFPKVFSLRQDGGNENNDILFEEQINNIFWLSLYVPTKQAQMHMGFEKKYTMRMRSVCQIHYNTKVSPVMSYKKGTPTMDDETQRGRTREWVVARKNGRG